MAKFKLTRRRIILGAFGLAALIALVPLGKMAYDFYFPALPDPQIPYAVVHADQGWSPEHRKMYYQTSQGTQIIPYDWYRALEVSDGETLFTDHDHMNRFRLIVDPDPRYNPDRLPVGITTDRDQETGQVWMSISCAACHTGQLHYNGLAYQIDGGPAMYNFGSHTGQIVFLLGINISPFRPAKKKRFFTRILGEDYTGAEADSLDRAIRAYLRDVAIPTFREAVEGLTPTQEGFARTEALGKGGNNMLKKVARPTRRPIDNPNMVMANAPVSFPPAWYTHDFDWVQSASNIEQPLGRNMTEDLGVNASLVPTGDPERPIHSSIRLDNLFWMETLLSTLEAPPWPEEIFGPVDAAKAERGRAIYEAACARCHSPVYTEPNAFGKRYIRLRVYPFSEAARRSGDPALEDEVVATDSSDAYNFASRSIRFDPDYFPREVLEPYGEVIEAEDGQLEYRDGLGVAFQFIIESIQKDKLDELGVPDSLRPVWQGFRENRFRAPRGYPARPLDGYWATPPYLHNGSVHSMYQLLLPPEERDDVFYVGNWEYDPVDLGFVSDRCRGCFKFDTRFAGNRNTGHDYGTDLSDDDRYALIEYLKIIDTVRHDSTEMAFRRALLDQYDQDYAARYR
ncbi:MAG: di-heme-cytochrome C peroxidase [Rhodothermales bacterium]|nr:di-heme-cytochrome C peroxidase [Rhodothermales bacterium]